MWFCEQRGHDESATGLETVVLDDVFVPDAAVLRSRPADRRPAIWNTIIGTAEQLVFQRLGDMTNAPHHRG
jgi:hypothetical protein